MIPDDYYIPVFALIAAFLITLVSIPSIVKVARMKHLFDEPDERTVHSESVPTLGGLAVFAGLSVSGLLFVQDYPDIQVVIAGVVALFFVGIKDDILVIAPLTKLLGQIFAASLLVIFTDIHFTCLHGFFGVEEISPYIGIPLTVFTVIVITNSFNLIDGIDGLSASIGITVAAAFGIWFFLSGENHFSTLAAVLIGSLLAFLRFNVFSKKNKIFMGDTGSLLLGFVISVFVIKFNELNVTRHFDYAVYGAPAVSFAVLIIPLFDTMRVMFLRAVQKKPIFYPDKQHLHHLFLKLGMSHIQTDLILVAINILFIVGAFYFHNNLGLRTLGLITVLMAMLIFYVPVLIIKRKKQKK